MVNLPKVTGGTCGLFLVGSSDERVTARGTRSFRPSKTSDSMNVSVPAVEEIGLRLAGAVLMPRVAKSSAALAQSGRLSRSIGRAFTGRAMDRHRRRARESYSGTGSGAAAHLSIVASDPSTREIAPHWAVRKTLAPARCQASIVAGAGCPNVCKRASRRRGVCAPRPIDARARARGSQARTRSADCEGAPG